MEALNTDDSAPTLADHKQQENANYTMGIDSEGTNKTQETSRTADGVGRSNGTHSSQTEQTEGDSRDSNKETWQRVGSSTAESQLHQRIATERRQTLGGTSGTPTLNTPQGHLRRTARCPVEE